MVTSFNYIKEKSHLAKHLNEGNQYVFRVAAENQYGHGPFVETPKPVKAVDPLSKLLSLDTKYCLTVFENIVYSS